jgi:hypothetical protein
MEKKAKKNDRRGEAEVDLDVAFLLYAGKDAGEGIAEAFVKRWFFHGYLLVNDTLMVPGTVKLRLRSIKISLSSC